MELRSPDSRRSLPLGAGGESRSALGTTRDLGGAKVAGPGGGRDGVGTGIGGKKARARGISETVSCWGGDRQRAGVKTLDRPLPPSAHHLTGDSGGRRRALGTAGGSSACSGLAARSSCVRQGLLSLAVAVAEGLVVAEAKVGGLAFRPPRDGEEGLPLGCIPRGAVK